MFLGLNLSGDEDGDSQLMNSGGLPCLGKEKQKKTWSQDSEGLSMGPSISACLSGLPRGTQHCTVGLSPPCHQRGNLNLERMSYVGFQRILGSWVDSVEERQHFHLKSLELCLFDGERMEPCMVVIRGLSAVPEREPSQHGAI